MHFKKKMNRGSSLRSILMFRFVFLKIVAFKAQRCAIFKRPVITRVWALIWRSSRIFTSNWHGMPHLFLTLYEIYLTLQWKPDAHIPLREILARSLEIYWSRRVVLSSGFMIHGCEIKLIPGFRRLCLLTRSSAQATAPFSKCSHF